MKAAKARHEWIVGTSLCLALGGAVGCGTLPIPRHAIEGTTITIGIPGSFAPGFGHRRSDAMNRGAPILTLPTVAYSQGHPAEDEIRGELQLMLAKRSNGQWVSFLPVRHVTRVHLDEASFAGNPDDGSAQHGGAAAYSAGQVLAFVDIPIGVVASGGTNEFVVFVTRQARMPGQPSVWETLPTMIGGSYWTGWGGANQGAGIPIDIFAGNGQRYNDDYKGWEGAGGYGYTQVGPDLEDLVPMPKVLMVVEDDAVYPAAWEAEIEYPRENGDVIGVEAVTNQKTTVMAMLASPVPSAGGCPTGSGVARVSMIDPRQRTMGVRLIIRPPDFSCGTSGRLVESNLAITSLVAYDVDGNEIPDTEVDRYFTGGIR